MVYRPYHGTIMKRWLLSRKYNARDILRNPLRTHKLGSARHGEDAFEIRRFLLWFFYMLQTFLIAWHKLHWSDVNDVIVVFEKEETNGFIRCFLPWSFRFYVTVIHVDNSLSQALNKYFSHVYGSFAFKPPNLRTRPDAYWIYSLQY